MLVKKLCDKEFWKPPVGPEMMSMRFLDPTSETLPSFWFDTDRDPEFRKEVVCKCQECRICAASGGFRNMYYVPVTDELTGKEKVLQLSERRFREIALLVMKKREMTLKEWYRSFVCESRLPRKLKKLRKKEYESARNTMKSSEIEHLFKPVPTKYLRGGFR